ncbi:MAG: YitT family protein [Rikenellaceae bacterium]
MDSRFKRLVEPMSSREWWRSIIFIVLGSAMLAFGYNCFISPYNIVPGGVYGLAIVMHNIFPSVQVGTFGYLFDIPLLISAIIILGRQFAGRTLFAALITPGLMNLFDRLIYPSEEAMRMLDPSQLFGGNIDLSNDLILATIMGSVMVGIGQGLVLRNRATTGGTDIIAMYLQRFAGFKFSSGMLLADAVIVLLGLFVIGFGFLQSPDKVLEVGATAGWKLSLYSLVTIYIISRVVDYVIDGASYDKLLFVISSRDNEELRDFIIKDLDRSATYIKAKGMYSNDDKEMIFLVVSRKEINSVQYAIKKFDPSAFCVVTDAYNTYGEGFKAFPDKDVVQAE